MLMDKKKKRYYSKELNVDGEKYIVKIERDDNDFVVVRFYTHPYKWWPLYEREVYYNCTFLTNRDGSRQSLEEVVISMMSEFINLKDADNKVGEDFDSWDGVVAINKEDSE